MKTLLSTGIALFSFLCLNLSASKAAAPLPRVVTAFASFSEKEGAIFVAEDQGFFRKYGLDVKHVFVSSGSIALSALASGDAHFFTGSPTGATLGAVAGGLDVVFVAGLVNKLNGTFAVEPSIKTPAELKGKTLGVQSIGGGIWMITMLLLNHWELDLKRDNIKFSAAQARRWGVPARTPTVKPPTPGNTAGNGLIAWSRSSTASSASATAISPSH